jgi:anaerobic ribonucleoside-triphosphate reductase
VFQLTGIALDHDGITSLFLRDEDADKLWRKLHRRKEAIKINQMREQYRKLCEGVDKLKVDNAKALGYQPGMLGPGGVEELHQCLQGR